MFTKQISLHRIWKAHYTIFKSKHIISILKAKILAKIIDTSIGNKKKCCKEKKVIIFLLNSYHNLASTFSAVMCIVIMEDANVNK